MRKYVISKLNPFTCSTSQAQLSGTPCPMIYITLILLLLWNLLWKPVCSSLLTVSDSISCPLLLQFLHTLWLLVLCVEAKCVCVCVFVCARIRAFMPVCVHACVCVCVCVHACMHEYVHVCMHACVCVGVCSVMNICVSVWNLAHFTVWILYNTYAVL